MTNKSNRIQIGGRPDYEDFHAVAAEPIIPGALLEVRGIDQDGTLTVGNHSTAGAIPQQPLFADVMPYSGDIEDDTMDPVDDPYPTGEYVNVIGAYRYNRINAILASGGDLQDAGTAADESADANIAEYENVTSAGDGTLRGTGVGGGDTFAHSREAVNNSGAAAGDTARLIIEVQ